MTDIEKAIIMAYTGTTMLTGEKLSIFHKYVEDILGRPVWTHEFANRSVWEEIKEKSKSDFLELCKNEETRKSMTMQLIFNKENMKELCDQIVEQIRTGELQLVEGPKAEWIPISEGVPIKNTKVLATFVNGVVGTAYYSDDSYVGDLVAWMPLPEPYKGGAEE